MVFILQSSTSSWSYRPKLSWPADPRSEPEPDDIDLVKCQFYKVMLMLENRDFVLYSQPVGIIHLLRWFFETQSAGTYVITHEGRMRSDVEVEEGTVYTDAWLRAAYTPDAPWEHARRTLGALETRSALVQHAHMRCMFAAHALEARWVCAHCALDLSRRTHNAYPACAPRVSGVGPALVQRWSSVFCTRLASFWPACPFMRQAPRTLLGMHKNPDAHNDRRRIMHNVGPARSTHE